MREQEQEAQDFQEAQEAQEQEAQDFQEAQERKAQEQDAQDFQEAQEEESQEQEAQDSSSTTSSTTGIISRLFASSRRPQVFTFRILVSEVQISRQDAQLSRFKTVQLSK